LSAALPDEEALTTNVAVEEADSARLGEEPEHAARAAELSRRGRGNFLIDLER
jgi:hypothetical protein